MRDKVNRFPGTTLVVAFICAMCICTTWVPLWAQSLNASTAGPAAAPEWEAAAGGKMAFESASMRQNKTAPPNAVFFNFPIGPGDVYAPTGGFFRASNLPLANYIFFAYKIAPNQQDLLLSQLAKWAATDRFDIQARASGNPTKDQMRLMVQALLADRFRLAAHHETRQVPVFALLVDQPGKLGPLLQKHPEDSACSNTSFPPSPPPAAPAQALDSRFPATCGGEVPMVPSAPGRVRGGARNVSMEIVAGSLTDGGVDLPIVDKTGLTGKYDFAIEFAPQSPSSARGNFRPDPTAPTFTQALREQLGLKIESQMMAMDFLVIDYIEAPSPN
jgi:uncharacterized protein (TIGR03435 family)